MRAKIKLYYSVILLVVSFFISGSALAQSLSQDDLNSIYGDSEWYIPFNTSSCSPSSDNNPSSGQLDLASIVQNHDLQSVIVKQVNGSVLGSVNATQPPATPASVLKLIIAHVFLSQNPDLDKKIIINPTEVYDPANTMGDSISPRAGQSFTLREMLTQTLMNSSDTDANVLIYESGGLDKVDSVAHSLGYSSVTRIGSYYNSKNKSTKFPNQSDVEDLTKAMETIYTATGSQYQVAQTALHNDTVNFGLDSDANKWGGTSDVTANSAVFIRGSNKYVITMYINHPYSPSQIEAIKDATNAILATIGQDNSSAADTTGCSSLNPPDPGDVAGNQALGKQLAAAQGWTDNEWSCLYTLWQHESGWRVDAWNDNNHNGVLDNSDAYGIPQSLPPDKMASAGADWRTNPTTQIKWGLGYISGRYHTPCSAWAFWLSQDPHWY